ncbi:MAG TPA: hypothetical protein PKG77_25060 [Phycisphaerae bacterium]|nr:hypothetical protein [Phycisphaerae bacterium]HQL76401.1 hypothetical protein [Phycisphaerae bacterium]
MPHERPGAGSLTGRKSELPSHLLRVTQLAAIGLFALLSALFSSCSDPVVSPAPPSMRLPDARDLSAAGGSDSPLGRDVAWRRVLLAWREVDFLARGGYGTFGFSRQQKQTTERLAAAAEKDLDALASRKLLAGCEAELLKLELRDLATEARGLPAYDDYAEEDDPQVLEVQRHVGDVLPVLERLARVPLPQVAAQVFLEGVRQDVAALRVWPVQATEDALKRCYRLREQALDLLIRIDYRTHQDSRDLLPCSEWQLLRGGWHGRTAVRVAWAGTIPKKELADLADQRNRRLSTILAGLERLVRAGLLHAAEAELVRAELTREWNADTAWTISDEAQAPLRAPDAMDDLPGQTPRIWEETGVGALQPGLAEAALRKRLKLLRELGQVPLAHPEVAELLLPGLQWMIAEADELVRDDSQRGLFDGPLFEGNDEAEHARRKQPELRQKHPDWEQAVRPAAVAAVQALRSAQREKAEDVLVTRAWRRIEDAWRRADAILKGRRGEFPYTQFGLRRLEAELLAARHDVAALREAGLLNECEEELLTIELERQDEYWPASQEAFLATHDPVSLGSRGVADRLARQLGPLRALAAAPHVRLPVACRVLHSIEFDLSRVHESNREQLKRDMSAAVEQVKAKLRRPEPLQDTPQWALIEEVWSELIPPARSGLSTRRQRFHLDVRLDEAALAALELTAMGLLSHRDCLVLHSELALLRQTVYRAAPSDWRSPVYSGMSVPYAKDGVRPLLTRVEPRWRLEWIGYMDEWPTTPVPQEHRIHPAVLAKVMQGVEIDLVVARGRHFQREAAELSSPLGRVFVGEEYVRSAFQDACSRLERERQD